MVRGGNVEVPRVGEIVKGRNHLTREGSCGGREQCQHCRANVYICIEPVNVSTVLLICTMKCIDLGLLRSIRKLRQSRVSSCHN